MGAGTGGSGMAEEPGKEQPADKGEKKAGDEAQAGTPSAAEERPLSEYLNARNFLLWASVVGVALPFIFAAQSGSLAKFATVSAVGIGILAASMATGGLLGFIFGIPTSLQNNPPPPPTADGQAVGVPAALYVGNTSLEQISDWLTKILVGVGLTQLSSIPTALADLGTFLAGGLGDLPGATVFAPLLVVFSILDGFFLSYLWTRLNLGSLLAQSDVNQRVAAAVREGRKLGKVDAAKTALVDASAAVGTAAPGSAALGPAGPVEILWVDDNPDYNTNERQAIRNLWKNVQFALARSTDEALKLLTTDPSRFSLVISDMGRPGDREAGFTLLQSMRDAGIDIPTIFYAASANPARNAEAQRLGARGMTNDPNQLLTLVGQAMRELGAPAETEAEAKPATTPKERR
jgi:CheY-like chemotaxis protein